MLVQIRPEYLTMEDRWGDIALLYLFWCNAPEEIIQFMVESYMTNYPQYEIGWVGMIFRMADSLSPKVSIQNLLNTHQRFPGSTVGNGRDGSSTGGVRRTSGSFQQTPY